MWFGVFIMAMAKLFDVSFRGQAIGYTYFILRIVGGNLPGLLVDPIKNATSYFMAMIILVPGLFILSAVLFLLAYKFTQKNK